MGSYKKIGLSHEMGLIDTPPLNVDVKKDLNSIKSKGIFVRENLKNKHHY